MSEGGTHKRQREAEAGVDVYAREQDVLNAKCACSPPTHRAARRHYATKATDVILAVHRRLKKSGGILALINTRGDSEASGRALRALQGKEARENVTQVNLF
jgi:hypothetical protein